MRLYPLWAFAIDRDILITRGETQEQALEWASRNVPRGKTIAILDYVPMYSNYIYDQNHPFNWLNTSPKWIRDRQRIKSKLSPEKKKALRNGIAQVIENIKKG